MAGRCREHPPLPPGQDLARFVRRSGSRGCMRLAVENLTPPGGALRERAEIAAKKDASGVPRARHRDLRAPGSAHKVPSTTGDDCAALPYGDEYVLFAAEGCGVSSSVQTRGSPDSALSPWSHVSDVRAMGGRPGHHGRSLSGRW